MALKGNAASDCHGFVDLRQFAASQTHIYINAGIVWITPAHMVLHMSLLHSSAVAAAFSAISNHSRCCCLAKADCMHCYV